MPTEGRTLSRLILTLAVLTALAQVPRDRPNMAVFGAAVLVAVLAGVALADRLERGRRA